MQFGNNLLSTASEDWILTDAVMDPVGELTISAGGSAEITYTELNGTNLLPEALKIAVTATSYPSRYLTGTFIRIKVTYTDSNTFVAILPITDIASGFAAILRPTVSNYDIDVSSYESINYYIYSETSIVLSTYTLQKSLGDALVEDRLYYGIKMSTEDGLVITRSDDAMRATFNADSFIMQVWDPVEETWVDKIYFDPALGDYVFAGTLSSDIIVAVLGMVTPILFASKAIIGNLTVDQVDTSDKVGNYLSSDTSDVNFQTLYDQFHKWITASTDGSSHSQVTNRNGELLYWTDGSHTLATTDVTAYPVYIYDYTELTKLEIAFEFDGSDYVPKIIMGAGTGVDDNGKTKIYKDATGFHIDYYHDTTGEIIPFIIDNDGINLSAFTTITYKENVIVNGLPQIWVDTGLPAGAKENDIFIDTDAYSRYDQLSVTGNKSLAVSDQEYIHAVGTLTITLHAADEPGVLKKIYNAGSGIITIEPLSGTINGESDLILFPGESVELITNGTDWSF